MFRSISPPPIPPPIPRTPTPIRQIPPTSSDSIAAENALLRRHLDYHKAKEEHFKYEAYETNKRLLELEKTCEQQQILVDCTRQELDLTRQECELLTKQKEILNKAIDDLIRNAKENPAALKNFKSFRTPEELREREIKREELSDEQDALDQIPAAEDYEEFQRPEEPKPSDVEEDIILPVLFRCVSREGSISSSQATVIKRPILRTPEYTEDDETESEPTPTPKGKRSLVKGDAIPFVEGRHNESLSLEVQEAEISLNTEVQESEISNVEPEPAYISPEVFAQSLLIVNGKSNTVTEDDLVSEAGSIYEIPDDFDPDQVEIDYGDTSFETPEEAMAAWGILPPRDSVSSFLRETSAIHIAPNEVVEEVGVSDDDADTIVDFRQVEGQESPLAPSIEDSGATQGNEQPEGTEKIWKAFMNDLEDALPGAKMEMGRVRAEREANSLSRTTNIESFRNRTPVFEGSMHTGSKPIPALNKGTLPDHRVSNRTISPQTPRKISPSTTIISPRLSEDPLFTNRAEGILSRFTGRTTSLSKAQGIKALNGPQEPLNADSSSLASLSSMQISRDHQDQPAGDVKSQRISEASDDAKEKIESQGPLSSETANPSVNQKLLPRVVPVVIPQNPLKALFAAGKSGAQMTETDTILQSFAANRSRAQLTETERILQSHDPEIDVINILRHDKKQAKANANSANTIHSEPVLKDEQIDPNSLRGKFEFLKKRNKENREQLEATAAEEKKLAEQAGKPNIDVRKALEAIPPSAASAAKSIMVSSAAQTSAQKPDNKNQEPGKVKLSNVTKTAAVSKITEPLVSKPVSIPQKPPALGANPSKLKPAIKQAKPPVAIPGQSVPVKSILKPSSQFVNIDAKPVQIPPKSPVIKTNLPYNYEHIREVTIRKIPGDTTYKRLLSQVRGGILEKAVIDWSALEARIVFVQPEAARAFHKFAEKNGIWIPTKLSHYPIIGNDSLVQCELSPFLWTENSAVMTHSMINAVYDNGATRCLRISGARKNITTEEIKSDIMAELRSFMPNVSERDVFESVEMSTDASGKRTVVIIFTAYTLAFRAIKAVTEKIPSYGKPVLSYAPDPCGGLIPGVAPPGREGNLSKKNDKGKGESNKVVEFIINGNISAIPPPGSGSDLSSKKLSSEGTTPSDLISFGRHPTNSNPVAQLPDRSASSNNPVMANSLPQPPLPKRLAKAKSQAQAAQAAQDQALQQAYDNWDFMKKKKEDSPPGSHWNWRDIDNYVRYQESLSKVARGHEQVRNGMETAKVDRKGSISPRPKYDSNYQRRAVYLTNLPRYADANTLFPYIRCGAIESLVVHIPKGNHDPALATIIFVAPESAEMFRQNLRDPGIIIDRYHRILIDESIQREGLKVLLQKQIMKYGWSRCIRIQNLPLGTTADHVKSVLEEQMNHNYLELEFKSTEVVGEKVTVRMRFLGISTAVWAEQAVERVSKWQGVVVEYEEDPCDVPLVDVEAR
ncbi:hypothetical protein RUND412_003735 [Rhizina undulata]